MNASYKDTVAVFRGIDDENRVKILQILTQGEKCACELLEGLHITQPTLSHHMKILCQSGLVDYRKEGKWMHYSLSDKGLDSAISILNELKNAHQGDQN